MITLDTHVIVWKALQSVQLSSKARKAIDYANVNGGILLCEISLWEIAMLIKKNRISIDTSYLDFISLLKASTNYIFKGITPEIANLSANFPSELNQDPADRIICATAILNNSELVTADENIRRSGVVKTIW